MLQRRLGEEGLAQPQLLEFADLIIQRLCQQLEEAGRRNLSFADEQRLQVLHRWGRWLMRKVAEEFFLRLRLTQEQAPSGSNLK